MPGPSNPGPLNIDDIRSALGADVLDPAGEKIGELDEIYYDHTSGGPEWIRVKSGMINKSNHLVPLQGARHEGGKVVVAYPKDVIEETPEITDDEISQETEDELYRRYNFQAGNAGLEEGRMAGEQASMPRTAEGAQRTDAGEAGVTLHEEQARIGKREVPAGTARIRKWVESDTVNEDVALRRERAEVHREPLDEPAPGARLGEETAEMDLLQEEAVVEKETRATERVSLERDEDVEEEEISVEVARERAEVDEGNRPGYGR